MKSFAPRWRVYINLFIAMSATQVERYTVHTRTYRRSNMLKYSFRLSLRYLPIALIYTNSSSTVVGTICVTKMRKVSGAQASF